MYKDTITLFNRYHSRLGDMWFPRILHNVDLTIDRAGIIAKYGAEAKDSARLHIKCDKKGNVQGYTYLPPKEWSKRTNDELEDYITFNTDANNFDFFIVGEYASTNPIIDADYIEGFYAELEQEIECYALTSASDMYKLIPHYEILAR